MKDQYKKLYSYTVPFYSQLLGDKLVKLAKDVEELTSRTKRSVLLEDRDIEARNISSEGKGHFQSNIIVRSGRL